MATKKKVTKKAVTKETAKKKATKKSEKKNTPSRRVPEEEKRLHMAIRDEANVFLSDAEELAEQEGIRPENRALFKTLYMWLSIPTTLIGKSAEYLKAIGIVDEDQIDLISCKTQTQFWEKYGGRLTTITEWKKMIVRHQMAADNKTFFKPLTKNIIMALYHAALREGDAARAKLWLQVIDGYVEESATKTHHIDETKKSELDNLIEENT